MDITVRVHSEKFCNAFRVCFLVSFENVMADLAELEKGMDMVRKEAEQRTGPGNAGPGAAGQVILRDFLANAEEKLRRLRTEAKSAQDAFRDCVEFFGESPRTTDANSFFSLFVRFARAFKVTSPNTLKNR